MGPRPSSVGFSLRSYEHPTRTASPTAPGPPIPVKPLLSSGLTKEKNAKKMGPPLGIGSPERCISFPASFSHRSVGSSILASLSEAGGNDPRKPASKPLPPRFANFHEPSTDTHPTFLL